MQASIDLMNQIVKLAEAKAGPDFPFINDRASFWMGYAAAFADFADALEGKLS
jgi:hypothetical protein